MSKYEIHYHGLTIGLTSVPMSNSYKKLLVEKIAMLKARGLSLRSYQNGNKS